MYPTLRFTTLTAARLFTPTLVAWLAAHTPAIAANPAADRLTGDTIVVRKQVSNKKYRIKLYPSANHEQLYFHAGGREGKVYQLFLFDVEGKLVRQATIKNEQTTVLRSLEKGRYSFEVFSDDERIGKGELVKK